MSYQVFARKYRPETFDSVLGQDHVIQTLRNAITQERLAHAYLFVGPRGTGKTTTARILSKALNCPGGPSIDFDPADPVCIEIAEGRSIDVLEIDGASNNGVEQVRELRETVKYAPASGRFKIYYIDEVHMLSNAAFNALLKTLEEPPEHVKFIFATTEPNKILPTIISRCQRFDLRPIPADIIAQHLLHIATEEKITLDEAAAWAIAKGADGGMRDAQSMLDQLVAFCGEKITEENVLDIFGFTSRETVSSFLTGIFEKQASKALATLHQQSEKGKDLSQLLSELVTALRALVVAKLDQNANREGFSETLWDQLNQAAEPYPTDRLLALIDIYAEADTRMKWASNKRLHFEIATFKAIQTLDEIRLSDVIKTLGKLPQQNLTTDPTDTDPAEKKKTITPNATPLSASDPENTFSELDTLIANAPEESPAPNPPQTAQKTTPKEKPITKAPPSQEPSHQKKPDVTSNVPPDQNTSEDPGEDPPTKDPLILEALEIFKAKLIN